MDFSTYPAQWEWVALGLGGVVFIMAVSPFLQMYVGRPKVRLGFTSRLVSGCTVLECTLENTPISNPVLRFLGLHRENAEDVSAAFKIAKRGSKEVVVPLTLPKLLRQGSSIATHISLPSSLFPARFAMVSPDIQSSVVLVYDDGNDQVLAPGEYTVGVMILADGKSISGHRDFAVHTNGDVYWLSS